MAKLEKDSSEQIHGRVTLLGPGLIDTVGTVHG